MAIMGTILLRSSYICKVSHALLSMWFWWKWLNHETLTECWKDHGFNLANFLVDWLIVIQNVIQRYFTNLIMINMYVQSKAMPLASSKITKGPKVNGNRSAEKIQPIFSQLKYYTFLTYIYHDISETCPTIQA